MLGSLRGEHFICHSFVSHQVVGHYFLSSIDYGQATKDRVCRVGKLHNNVGSRFDLGSGIPMQLAEALDVHTKHLL